MAKFKIGGKLKDMIASVAPALGLAAGGPLGGVVGKMVQEALGVDSEAAALQAIQADPDALLKLKEVERAFEQRMAELDIDLERVHAADRDSARALAKTAGMRPQIVLSVVYTAGYFGVVAVLLTGQWVPAEGTETLVASVIGVLTAVQVKIADFWFGSSAGSKEKTAALARNGH